MKKAQRKDFFVEIKRSLNRYLSILFIVALGVAFFSGIRAAEPDMRLSADAVADEANFMDIRVISTMGLTEGDLEAIGKIEGITAVEGEYSSDFLCVRGEKELVLHVASLSSELNQLTVKEGRLPEKSGECLIDEQLLQVTEFALGDEITLNSGTKDPVSDTLKRETYTVVGIGTSPYYLNLDRGSAQIGNGDVKGFVMVPKEDFALEVYTQIYAAADGLDGFVTAGKDYKEGAEALTEAIEAIAGERCEIRLAEIKKDAEEEIAEGEAELADARKEAETELADARAELLDGEEELSDGRKEIEDNEKKLADAKAEIADGEKALEDGRIKLADGERELSDGREELAANERKVTEARALLEEKRAEFEQAQTALAEARAQYEAGKAEADAGRQSLSEARTELSGKAEQLNEGFAALEAGRKELESSRETLEVKEKELAALREMLLAAGIDPETNPDYPAGMKALEAGKQELAAAEELLAGKETELLAGQEEWNRADELLAEKERELAAAEATLAQTDALLTEKEAELEAGRSGLSQLAAGVAEGEKALEAGRRELAAGETRLEASRQELLDGERELAEGRQEIADGEEALAEAKETLADGEKELSDGWEAYEEAKAEADEKLADGEQELADARAELEDLEMPEWYVLDRDSVQSYVEFDSDADRIGAIGKVFPVVFFLVAALVSLTTMTRMVAEKRTEIGTMKALGYSTMSIASKYIFYALTATLAGSVLGFLVGEKALPWVIITTYKILYTNLNVIRIPYNWGYALGAAAISLMCTVGATLAACLKATMSQPSELMRPVAPLKGKKIFLERVRPLWRHLNFSWKSTLRNLLRYKQRLLMTVFGIGACMALLIVGFGLRDSIYVVSDKQYGELWRYDATATIEKDAGEAEKAELKEALLSDEAVSESLAAYTAVMDAEANGVTKEVNLVVPEDLERFPDFFVLRDRKTKKGYSLDDSGVIISEKLAKYLDVEEGDTFTLKESDVKGISVRVSHITENYVYNYVYASANLYRELYGKEPESNAEYLKITEVHKDREQELVARLLKQDAVSGVTLVSDMNQSILDMLGSLYAVVWVLIISAGLLAFVVLYNLNNINITERRRELATIRLLGFYDMELAMYVYRENILLTGIGIVAGVFMGSILHRFVIRTVEVDLIMFGRTVHPVSYLYGAGLTALFAVLVNVTMFYKLRRIDMVESLKSVE